MALTRDTATQEETFDVPIIAGGTFLWDSVGHQRSGRRQGQPDVGAEQEPCSQIRPSGILALALTAWRHEVTACKTTRTPWLRGHPLLSGPGPSFSFEHPFQVGGCATTSCLGQVSGWMDAQRANAERRVVWWTRPGWTRRRGRLDSEWIKSSCMHRRLGTETA